MIKAITDFVSNVSTYANENPIFAGILSLYGLGIITFLLKNVPSKIIAFLKKHLTTTVQIGNIDIAYYRLMKLLETNNVVNKIRTIKFHNGAFGSSDKIIKSIGTGSHLIWYLHTPIILSVVAKEGTFSKEEKLVVSLIKLGRSHKIFDKIKSEIEKDNICSDEDKDKIKIYKYTGYWEYITHQNKRDMNTIFLDKKIKQSIIDIINNFLNNEPWYIERGIPYQLGLLFYGTPGSGKTSLIKAIASYFNKQIAVTDAYKLYQSIINIPENSILVIEDIDAFGNTHKRGEDSKPDTPEKDCKPGIEKVEEEMSAMGLSELLNSLDGLISIHGRIIIMTTNHIEKLDAALIRPGRIDYKIEISYISITAFIEFLTIFFQADFTYLSDRKIKQTTIAELQTEYMLNKDAQYFIDKYLLY